eukprot:g560.t1
MRTSFVILLHFALLTVPAFAHEDPIHDTFDPDCPGIQRTLKEAAIKLEEEFRMKMIPFLLTNTEDPTGAGGFMHSYNATGAFNTSHRQLVNQAQTLYTLSLLHNFNSTPDWHKTDLLIAADRGYSFLQRYFLDTTYGGYFWSVNSDGQITSDQKNTEGHLTLILALVEYSRAKQNKSFVEQGQELFDFIHRRIQDAEFGGYYSDFDVEWTPIARPLGAGPSSSYGLKTQRILLKLLETLTELYLELGRASVEVVIEQILDDDVNLFFPRNPRRAVESRLWNLRSYRVGGSMSYGIYTGYVSARVAAEEALGRQVKWGIFDRYLDYSIEEGMLLGGLTNDGELVWWASDYFMDALTTAMANNRSQDHEMLLKGVFHFQTCYMIDPVHGFSIWSVDRKGHPSFAVVLGPWKTGFTEIRSKINFVNTVMKN